MIKSIHVSSNLFPVYAYARNVNYSLNNYPMNCKSLVSLYTRYSRICEKQEIISIFSVLEILSLLPSLVKYCEILDKLAF